MKVLIIEDNESPAHSIRDFLVREICICELAFSCAEAEEKMYRFQYGCMGDSIVLHASKEIRNGTSILQ